MRLTLALLCILIAPTAYAQGSCYGRFYEEEHMASHPEQTVEEIFFGTVTGVPILQVRLRGAETYLWQASSCEDAGTHLACALEGSGGNFRVTVAGEGTITLDIGPGDVLLERGGDQDIALLSDSTGDDRSFLLYQGKGCIN